jgi:hypothetical protein
VQPRQGGLQQGVPGQPGVQPRQGGLQQGVPGQPRPGLQRPTFQNRPALPRRPPVLPKGKKEKR